MNKHEISIISISNNDYVIRTKKGDFRLGIYTDGIVVERGCYVDAGKHGYIWETKGHLFYEDNRRIKRRTKKIANEILQEVIKKITNEVLTA